MKKIGQGPEVECACGSSLTRLISTEEDIDVYHCDYCGEYFENDNFAPHEKRKIRKERDKFDDKED